MLLLLCGIEVHTNAQSAVYKTFAEYSNKKTSLVGDCMYGDRTVRFSDFFLRPYIYIKTADGKMKIHTDSVFAIQDCKGHVYRVCGNRALLVEDRGVIVKYSHRHEKTVKKHTIHSTRFCRVQATDYFFSLSENSAVYPLTTNNLRLALLLDKPADSLLQQRFADCKSLREKQAASFSINDFLKNVKNK